MALTLSGESKPYVTDIPADSYVAVCVGIFDLGTVHSEQFDKDSEKLALLFEFPDLIDPEGFPKTHHIEVSQSLHKKARLRELLTTWRGKDLTEAEMKSFDIKALLGKGASILIVHEQGKGLKSQNVYANIKSITGLPKGVPAPKPTRALCYFDFTEGKTDIDGIPEFLQKKIVAAPEWRVLKEGRSPEAGPKKAAGRQAPAEIVGLLNEIGLGYPYSMDQLDKVFPADAMSQADYDLLAENAVPF